MFEFEQFSKQNKIQILKKKETGKILWKTRKIDKNKRNQHKTAKNRKQKMENVSLMGRPIARPCGRAASPRCRTMPSWDPPAGLLLYNKSTFFSRVSTNVKHVVTPSLNWTYHGHRFQENYTQSGRSRHQRVGNSLPFFENRESAP
jgi:hypothetical protein